MSALPAPGLTFADRYAIARELGHGGMATVWLADDPRNGRQVAIKVLRQELAASLSGERFLREIGIAARLTHPHILPLIDSGDAGGVLYYVSPFVPEGSLRQRLTSERHLAIGDAVRIAHEVGAGLDFAHRSGFVHRDVKPENILFADGHALLADFGVARTCSTVGLPADVVTDAGIAVGTPEYMSPEQAAGEQHLEPVSDVYSLACVVYEMLAGAPPFTGGGARAVMARQVTEAPRPVRAHRPDVPAGIEVAVMRALAKDPARRFQTVAEFVAAIEAPVAATARRVSGIARTVAVLPFVNASPEGENEYLSDGITDELIDALAKVQGLRVASRTSVFALKGKPLDVRAIGALLGASEVLEGTVRRAGSRLRVTALLSAADDGRLLWSQRYDRTFDDVLAIQDEIARTIVATLRSTSFADLADPAPAHQTGNVTAYGLYLKGRYAWNQRSQDGVAEGIAYFEQAIAEDPTYALAYTGLADSYALQVDYRSVPVDEGFARAREYARKAIALDDGLAEAHASLAWVLFIYDWDFAGARAEFLRAIELQPKYATAHQWYAFLLAARGDVDEGLVEAHTATELDPASVSVRRSLAWLYMYARRYDRARDQIQRAIEMNPTADENYRILALTLALMGDVAEAERVCREALTLPGAGTYTTATLGYILGRAGREDEAREILAGLAARARVGYVSPVAFATVLLGLGDTRGALDWAERAVAERRGWPLYFRVNPVVDPLRGDPRFQDLLRRIGI